MLDIVRATERHNAASGATGMLVFSSGGYLQYFEGPAAAHDATWARISADPRHRLLWLVTGEAEAPRFAGLPLGYFDADRETSRVQDTPLWAERRDWNDDQAEVLIALLHEIAREKYPAALAGGG